MIRKEQFKDTSVLVIGDVMLDRYWWGSVTRISPEAPVPIVRLKKTTVAAGGAANVAANVAGLGARPVLVGIVGADADAGLLRAELERNGVASQDLVELASRPTTVKTRVIAHSQQVTRVDQEFDAELSDAEADRLLEMLIPKIAACSAVVLSDYAKGMLTRTVLDGIIAASRSAQKPVLVDPKGKDFSKYSGATLLTPNKREAAEACKLEENGSRTVDLAGERLLSDLEIAALLITQGEEGMTLFERGSGAAHFHALARQVYDVTGAGDTVIATLAAAVGAGMDLRSAAQLANIAAGVVVEQVGTTTITFDALEQAIREHKFA
ncbi:MAG: D-glycero-beta-D-manno-heptose-7-phosphate kinase [Pyrinomonadaceae bacterium]